MGGEDDKIVRVPGESLAIKVSPEEEAYRKKYLPDPKRLTDEKLVCTVCSTSLALSIHKGKDLFIHRALNVLVCEACFNFYGDGCFSADEDGDDKYCRWCGQGGTLFLCSACNCAFCQKCTKQNLKSSVLAELENDDWKCYICNPRPLFGCRTICWGAQQLNQIGKEKEEERLKKIKERLEKMEAKKKEKERRSRRTSRSEDEGSRKKRTRSSDEDSSSPEVISAPKRRRLDSRGKKGSRSMNGIGRRRKDSSSDSESQDDKKVTRNSRGSNKKERIAHSSSEDESEGKRRKDKLKKKKKKKDSDESSDTGKKKPKRGSMRGKNSSDSSSEDEKSKKKHKQATKKRDDSSDSSSGGKRKKNSKKKKNHTSSEGSSEETRKKHKKTFKKKAASSSDSDEPSKNLKKTKNKKQLTADSDNETNKIKKSVTDSEDAISAEDILVKKRINLAILWLKTMVNDISELGSLISLRATNFSKKKINSENLKSYDDVLKCVSKIKQLIAGVHSNYDHIEKTLDSHLKPWKILTGLEDADNEKHVDGESSTAVDEEVLKADETVVKALENSSQHVEVNGSLEESKLDCKTIKNEETVNNWSDDSDDQNETRALISKVNESLEKSQIEDQQSETNNTSPEDKSSNNTKIDSESIHEDESSSESKAKSKTSKSESEKPKSKLSIKKLNESPSKGSADDDTCQEKSSKSKKDVKSLSENEESLTEKNSLEKENSTEDKNCERSEDDGESKKTESEGDKEKSHIEVEGLREDSSEKDSQVEFCTSRRKKERQSGGEMNLKQSLDKELDNNEGKEKPIPKIILKKCNVDWSKDEHEITNTSKTEIDKKKDEEEDSTSEDEGKSSKKTKARSKTRNATDKTNTNNKRSNCLSSSDEEKIPTSKGNNKRKKREEAKEESEDEKLKSKAQKEKSESKPSRKSKLKESDSDDDKSEDEKLQKSKEQKKKLKSKLSRKGKSKESDSDDDKSDDEKLDKSKEQKETLKTKHSRRGKSKKSDSDDDQSDEEKHEKAKAQKEKLQPKASRKGKSKESESDDDKSDDEKLDKSKGQKETLKTKHSRRGKSKKNDSDDDQSDVEKREKSKAQKEKLQSKASRKGKSKESESDDDKSDDEKLDESKEQKETLKAKHSRRGKSKERDSGDDKSDEEKHGKSKAQKAKLQSKASRKGKLQECDSDNDNSIRGKKMKLKESKDTEENDEIEDEKKKTSSNCEETDEMQTDLNNELNGDAEDKFSLELAASSNENSNDVDMVQEHDNKSENIKEENVEDGTEESTVIEKIKEDKVDSKEEKLKFVGLGSSSDEEIVPITKKKVASKKKAVKTQKNTRNVLVLSSDDEAEQPTNIEIESSEDEGDVKKEEKDDDFAVVLESSADSSDSEILPKNKRKKKNSSDSDDASISDEEKIKKKKRRRVKCADSSNESGCSGDDKKEGESPAKGGRKNIKKIKKKGDLEQTTIEAAEEEKERRRRIEERQKLFNQVFEVKESTKLEKLVLDFDPETKSELISVNKDLVAKMKPHQAKGVKFMWDSCFESVKQIKKTKGSGCILAHCMGLGKTFQVVSLVHTLLTHEEYTKVRTVMVVCPLSTVLNWVNEFAKWLEDVEGGDDIEVFHLTKYVKNPDRARELRRWQHNGGVLIMGYEMFRNLTNETTKKFKAKMKKDFLETLTDPGADLIVCDEGHMLKNEATALSKAMTRVKTLRRIVLTGTPMQNNLKEYHCMVTFVKPNLLGTSKEFLNRFVNPINNGQFVDSTDHDVKLMKRRAHVLHKMLEGLVQRFDYNVLTPFLPPKQEYVISVCLSELQEKLYSHYLENQSQKSEGMKGGTRLFMDWQSLGRVWTHPRVLKMSTDKANWLKEKKAMEASDSEGSLRDFIDDDSDKSTTSEESSDFSSDEESSKKKSKTTHKSRSTRATRQSSNVALLESSDEEKGDKDGEEVAESASQDWWGSFVEPHHFEDMRQSGKLLLLFAILKECEMIEDKVLVFSQSLFSLDLIEYFLDKIDCATQEGRLDENLNNHQGTWSKGLDYFRLDGSTSSENRNIWCKAFNREDNPRARLFLISTRAGGLGINLTAANRVIIFDASWNPSHDIQSIFRIYRFGQKKPCYVYRFVAYGTMEEKVYERQVAKQSISNRVVDEQQVHRHFSMNDLTELYSFTPASKLEDRPTPALPRDPLMTEILSQMKQWIEKYHEHDSLLENVVEEELNEDERKAAWEDYENDKKRGFMPPAGPQGPSMNPNAAWNQQIEIMRQQLKVRYANKSDDEINQILVYQVSLLMRQQQQQQMQMMQAAGNMGYRPQNNMMYGNNMMGGFNQRPQLQTTAYLRNIAPKPSNQQYSQDQVLRMQQQQANLARLQMQQLAAQHKSQQQTTGQGKVGQSLLGAQLAAGKYPTANMAAQLQKMKQSYQESRQAKPGVVITEITDSKPSGSSES